MPPAFAFPVFSGLLSAPGPAPEPAAEFPAAQDAHSLQGVSAGTGHRHWYCSLSHGPAGAQGILLSGLEELGSI